MTALARAGAEEGPSLLDGLHPDAVGRAVKEAIAAGLMDDLDWLAPSAAGVALYDLAAALPPGSEQRELGRRVLARLLAANAETFAAIATRMAQTSGKGLSAPGVRARIALVTELPIGWGVPDGPLALALVSRRELAREWIGNASTRSLPARRLAARLLERAAREAAKRAAQSDLHALRAFASDAVRDGWARLLADRESLVWRHAAIARGLLAPWLPEARQQIEASVAHDLTPTEWRRGATSIAAMCAVDPQGAVRLGASFLAQGACKRDAGVASAFLWGLGRGAEAEPEAAGELLDRVMLEATSDVAEAVLELRNELGESVIVERATERAIDLLSKVAARGDDGAETLTTEIRRDLERGSRHDEPLRLRIDRGLLVFAHEGAKQAHAVARELLDGARAAVEALEAVGREDEESPTGRVGQMARRTALAVLRDLDLSLLERNVIADLMRLGTGPEAARAGDDTLDALRERMTSWILAREAPSTDETWDSAPEPATPAHPTLRLRRLRTLLHLVDGDFGEATDEASRSAALRMRWQRVVGGLLQRYTRSPAPILRRTLLATLARALEALVRMEACDVADVLLVLATDLKEAGDFQTMAEASMDPDLTQILEQYARYLEAVTAKKLQLSASEDEVGSMPLASRKPSSNAKLVALAALATDLASGASSRVDALRAVLGRLQSALAGVESATTLHALSSSGSGEPDLLVQLETAIAALAQMCIGARARLSPERGSALPPSLAGLRPLSVAVSRVLSGAEPSLGEDVMKAGVDELARGLPPGIGRVVSAILWGLAERPVGRRAEEPVIPLVQETPLPAWLPARRTIGGFYVLRPLGSGAAGTVFVVNRVEDRHDPNAERFALKVPDYSVTAARSVSEAQFHQLFRDEASALLTIPTHPNLARFVTFDLAARPKPILVMELVEGVNLEHIIESRALDMKRCFRILDDVLAGLEAMHGVGVGHLDLKPSNVVLRKNEQAVLVDFGLAGRNIRPGCATGPYGAPEVWGVLPDGAHASPLPVDVYAFACLAYEALTGKLLFSADSEVALVSAHITHDGSPPPVKAMAGVPKLASLAELFFSMLRRDPRQRIAVSEVRAGFKWIASSLESLAWPLDTE
jgi:hypothetical protein